MQSSPIDDGRSATPVDHRAGPGLGPIALPAQAGPRRDGPVEPGRATAWTSSPNEVEATISLVLRRFRLQEADREDCRQSIWEEILGTCRERNRGPNTTAWLAALARNKAVDPIRRPRRRPHLSLAFEVDATVVVGDREGERERARATVWAALGRLEDGCDPTSFLIFFLRSIEGWSITEASSCLGISPGQARQRHHRLKGKFLALIEADAGGRVRPA